MSISPETRAEMVDAVTKNPYFDDPELKGDPVYGHDEECMVVQLLAAEVLFVSGQPHRMAGPYARPTDRETLGLVVNCNDLFYWACGDAEGLSYRDIPVLWNAWERDGRGGVERWVCLHRGMRPQTPVERDWRAAGVWDAALEALPPRDPKDCG